MQETKVKAIVIENKDYKEKDKIVTLFTLEQGLISVLFKSVKSNNAKLKAAKEMFSFGDYIYVEGKQNTAISADVLDSFYDLTKDISKFYVACQIFEIIKTILPFGEADTTLFINTLKSMKLLAYENVDLMLLKDKFLITVFEEFGYKFTLGACNVCGENFLNHRYINLNHGDITCYNCRSINSIEITAQQYAALRLLAQTSYEKLLTLKLNNDVLNQVFNILNANFEQRFNKKLTYTY